MKKIQILLASLIIASCSFAQEEPSDTTKLRIGNKKVIIVDGEHEVEKKPKKTKSFNSHWSSYGFGINSYLAPDYQTELPTDSKFMDLNVGKSWEFSLNIMELNFGLVKNRLGINTGLGFRFNNYRFSNNTLLTPTYKTTEDKLVYTTDTLSEFKKNKLTTYGVHVPVMLSVHFPMKDNMFIISAGPYAGIRYHVFTKQKIISENSKFKTKHKNDFHTNPFYYGLEARIGTDDFMLYAHLDMSELFDENKGPELYPFSIGAVIPF